MSIPQPPTAPTAPTAPTDNLDANAIEIPKEAPKNPREAAMESVVSGAIEQRELIEASFTSKVAPEAQEKLDNVTPTQDTPIVERDGETFLRTKVGGEAREVPLDTVLEIIQKNQNADVIQYKASNALKEAEQLKATLEEKLRSTSTQPDDSAPATPATKEAFEQALSKLYDDGDVAGSADILSKALAVPVQQPTDVTSIVVDTLNKLEDQKNLNAAYSDFKADERFGKLIDDSILLDRVDKATEVLMDDAKFMGENPSYSQIFEKAGNEVLDWVQTLAPKSPGQAQTTIELKRSTATRANARSVRRSTPQPTAAPTREDTMSKIAASRGQTYHS